MSVFPTVWTRPGSSPFRQKIADPEWVSWSGSPAVNGVEDGTLDVFEDWDRIQEVIYQDPDDLGNSIKTLIRLFDEDQALVPVWEFFAEQLVPNEDDETAMRIAGPHVGVIAHDAITEPWDWDGSDEFVSQFPDWVWGGKNILGDLDCRYEPEVVDITPNGNIDDGTFIINVTNSLGSDSTNPIAWTADAITIRTELEALTNVTTADVERGGTIRIQFVDPETDFIVATNDSGLIGKWVAIMDASVTSGDWAITVDGDSTAPLAWNISAVDLKTALEAIPSVTEVDVEKRTDPTTGNAIYSFQFINPTSPTTFTTTDVSLGGGTVSDSQTDPGFSVDTAQQGVIRPVGWTEAINRDDVPHGFVAEWRCWATGDPALPAGVDQAVMFNGTEVYFPGLQKFVQVKPGGIYQMSGWLYANADEVVRVILRDFKEAEIPGASVEVNLTAGVWTQYSVSDVMIPDGVEAVAHRIGHTGEGDPGRIWFADPKMEEGLQRTSPGGIIEALYTDATTGHPSRAPGGMGVWWDGTRRYFELDFTAAVDSAGVAWDNLSMSYTVKRGKSLLEVLLDLAKLGYEFVIVPKTAKTGVEADDGVWLLQMFNPGGLGVDRSADQMPQIHTVTRRGVRYFAPQASKVIVEGEGGVTARVENVAAATALGHSERYISERDLESLVEVQQRADQALSDMSAGALSLAPVYVPLGDDWRPGVQFGLGDVVAADLPPLAPDQAERIIGWTMTPGSEGAVHYELQLSSEATVGRGSIGRAVEELLRKFDRRDDGGDQDGTGAFGQIASPTPSGRWVTFTWAGNAGLYAHPLGMPFPRAYTLTLVAIRAQVAPQGADLIGELYVDEAPQGVTVTIPDGQFQSEPTPIAVNVPVGSQLQVGFSQVGSSVRGGNIVWVMEGQAV